MTVGWQSAERLAVEHMRSLGYDDAMPTGAGTDAGLDAVSTRHGVAAQVKHYAMPVGRPDVQRFVGASRQFGDRLFYARSGYTRAAVEYANETDVALFQYPSGAMQPASQRAVKLNDNLNPDWRLQAALDRQRELDRAQHLRDNPSPSDWDYEYHNEFGYTVGRHLSLARMLPSFEARIRASDMTNGDATVKAVRKLAEHADALLLAHWAAVDSIPRRWTEDVQRLYGHRATVARLEAAVVAALGPALDVSQLLDLDADHEMRDLSLEFLTRCGPVEMPPTDEQWRALRFRIAAAIVRREALLAALPELDKKATFKMQWRSSTARARAELLDVATPLSKPSYWVGDDHYEARRRGVDEAMTRMVEVEANIAQFWSTLPKERQRIDVVAMVNRLGDDWMSRNENQPEVQFLRPFGYMSRPLERLLAD